MRVNFQMFFKEKHDLGITIRTDFSGIGSPEFACHRLQSAARMEWGSQGFFKMESATEISASCRRALQMHGAFSPLCVFDDILEREPGALKSFLTQNCQKHEYLATRNVVSGSMDKGSAKRQFGKRLFESVIRPASDMSLFPPIKRAKCVTHASFCHVSPKVDRRGCKISVGGLVCTHFSNRGKRRGLLDPENLRLIVTWIRERLTHLEDFAIIENVVGFDTDVLKPLLHEYQLEKLILCPSQFGLGCTRKRLFLLLVRRSRFRFHEAVAEDIPKAFAKLFFQDMFFPAISHFHAPVAKVHEFMASRAHRRGMPPCKQTGKTWSWFQCAAPGTRIRAVSSERVLLEKGFVRRFSDRYFDCAQNPSFGCDSPQVGTLVRNSEWYSTRRRRCLLPGESAELMGFGPCYVKDDYTQADDRCDRGPDPCSCDLQQLPPLLQALSNSSKESAIFAESTLKSFCGNAMHVTVVQAVLVFLCGCTRKV